ncbi:uncharacterized protein F5Z01DRAFT_676059 [Emericellopsis atlantica]|uniref:Phospholipid-transporting ATPase n=1 Tax=Emericellopsis atlantica TaxID=2614577 RepID=A0A9P7ZIF8_9HYPO|nr:uncharacterized protein F5Z01DRAFT_676059 [Emericellopsis atlantica]KAG9252170.1 hypothetical protein F5Z01DRAFT_676059 [Emericellopsis atlantica]
MVPGRNDDGPGRSGGGPGRSEYPQDDISGEHDGRARTASTRNDFDPRSRDSDRPFAHATPSQTAQARSNLHRPSSRESLGARTPTSISPIKEQPGASPQRHGFRDKLRKRRLAKKSSVRKPIARATWKDRLRDQLSVLWQFIVIETILRQKPLPPSKDGRQIPLNPADVGPKGLIDERREKTYINNFIRSNRYTIFTFIPAQLIYQFSKLGNFYFLVVGIVQMIPGLSTVGRWTTIAPLAAFIAFSMAKEGYDDWRRYQLDKTENRAAVWVLASGVRSNPSNRPKRFSGKGWKKGETAYEEKKRLDVEREHGIKLNNEDWIKIQWQHVQVGDVVRLHRDQAIPADVALLHATGPNGIAYIDTMALDGETNLKSKQASPMFAEKCSTMAGLKTTQATVVSEDPNMDLYNYDGKAVADGETLPLTMANVVYRGSTLRNTSLAIGLVINSGEECKIRMNANKNTAAKKPRMQSMVNRMVLVQIFAVCMLAAGMTIGYVLWQDRTERDSWYLRNANVSYTEIFFGYVIMFNTLIPLSLYVSLEIVKIGQFLQMQDAEMYDPVSDTPASINTTSTLEDLGQVGWVFSDKTGTLTENIMRFRKMSVAGVPLLHDMNIERDEAAKERKIQQTLSHKGKGKHNPLMPDVVAHHLQERDYEHRATDPSRPTAQRMLTSASLSRWHSNRPGEADPEMKTEDLLDLIRRKGQSSFARKAKHFLLCIALCHTCLPERTDDGRLEFQAANPDELALIEAARDFGYLMIDRPVGAIKLQSVNSDGSLHVETYEVLSVVEFSSKRKRMSIIVRMPDGRICVICKGADNVIRDRLRMRDVADQKAAEQSRRMNQRRSMEQSMVSRRLSSEYQQSLNEGWRMNLHRRSTEMQRLAEEGSPRGSMDQSGDPRQNFSRMKSYDSADQQVNQMAADAEDEAIERVFQHVDDFASDGLRTLLYGSRYIDESTYNEWREIYHEAETSLVDRQEKIEEASDLIEQDFDLVGATAIEDKLQDGVADTIDKLRRANIKIWMLTGDKRETAINIGHSAGLCKTYSQIYILDSTSGHLHETLSTTLNQISAGQIPHTVLVVDGQTLQFINDDDDCSTLFYDITVLVDSVICCRASPSQKADLVNRIRRYVPKSMTLAIGDGANDIGMILASHVGIGISGREGLQAARISDFSIAQFRFLQKLLFVHGRWNYLRTGRYVLATFWKEIMFYLVQAHYQRSTGYSGTSLYENWSLTVFNVLFTSLSVIMPGIFDKDLDADTLLAVPELYTYGQKSMGINYFQYFGWVVMAVIGSVIIFYPTWWFYHYTLFTADNSIFAMGCVCFTVAVVFINIKLFILECHYKTIIIFGGFALSVAGWFLWMIIISQTYEAVAGIYVVKDGFLHNFGPTLAWWTIILLELAALVVIDLAVQSIRRVYFPNDQDLMQRVEKDARKKKRKGIKDAEKGGADVELDEVAGEPLPAHKDVDQTASEGQSPGPLRRDVAPGAQEQRADQAQSMAWTGNADYYYDNVDPKPPAATQPTQWHVGQAGQQDGQHLESDASYRPSQGGVGQAY